MSLDPQKYSSFIQQAELPNNLLREIAQVNVSAAKEAMIGFKNQQIELALNKAAEDVNNVDDKSDKDKVENSQGKDADKKAAEHEKAAASDESAKDEAKEKEKEKETKAEDQKDHQDKPPADHSTIDYLNPQTEHLNLDDVSVIQRLSPFLKMLLLGGHDSNLQWNPYGDPIFENSVPRNFDIFHNFIAVLYHVFPNIPPEITQAIGGPCCVDPISIIASNASSSVQDRSLTELNAGLNNAFKFTFEYFCDRNEGEIVFSQVAPGVKYSPKGGVEQYTNFTPETFIIHFSVDSDSCCPLVNCDNPIEQISIGLIGYRFSFPCIDYFVNSSGYNNGTTVYFLDSGGHQWELINDKKNFVLQCADTDCGCSCENPVNIVFNANEVDFISPQESQQISNLLSSTFNFTFAYNCDSNEPTLTLLINGSVFASYEEGSVGYGGSTSAQAFYDINIVQPNGQDDCVPLSCDNPLVNLNINLQDTFDFYNFDSINDFLFRFFIDTNGDILTTEFVSQAGDTWNLLLLNDAYNLVCDFKGGTAPMVFDLNHNGVDISSIKDSSVMLNIDGVDKKVSWVGPQDGILTYNYSGEGPIENKNFILTENVQGAQSDLQALQLLAGQKGGILDMSNPIWDKLGMWQDANQDGKMEKGEYHTLSELKIASINIDGDRDVHYLNGNIIANNVSFTYQDGTTGKAADAILKTEDVVQNNQPIPEVSAPAGAPVTVAANDASSAPVAPVAPLHVDQAVQSAIETQQQVVQTG